VVGTAVVVSTAEAGGVAVTDGLRGVVIGVG